MATQQLELVLEPSEDTVSLQINQLIDRLILSLEQRRAQLLFDLRDRREEMRANQVARQQIETQLAETRAFLQREMTHNLLHTIQEKVVSDLEVKMEELQVATPSQEIKFLCDLWDLEEHISSLGEIIQVEIPSIPSKQEIPNYAKFLKPTVAVGKKGSAPGEFNAPKGVSVDTGTGHIYVADSNNRRIQIFSETADSLNQFGQDLLKTPWGILTHQESIYVTDCGHNAIFLFNLLDLTMVKRAGKKGSGNEEINNPGQLAISPNQQLYVADEYNNRIQILSSDLAFQGSIRDPTMTHPVDIKFSQNEMFVLSRYDNPSMHVFSLSGEKSRSRGIKIKVEGAYFFCLDKHNNFVISDYGGIIRVFSPKGNLLHEIKEYEHETAWLFSPPASGVAIFNTKLVCVFENKNYGLQIFS